MKIKRIGSALLLVMIVACTLMITACGESKHSHSYTSTVTNPTCTEKGYTKHTCSCGDSYVDAYVDATGEHIYTTKIVTYPTATVAGKREGVCSVCGSKVEETIGALVLSMPDISGALHTMLGGQKYTLDASDSEFITVYEKNGEETGSHSLAFKLAEIVLDGKGETAVGHVKLELASVGKDNGAVSYQEKAVCYIYINGDAVSVEITSADGSKEELDVSLSAKFYEALSAMAGMPLDQMAMGSFVLAELEKYMPVLQGLATELPAISEDFVAILDEIVTLVGENIVTATPDGTNTVYTVNIAALKEFLALVEGKTVSEILDEIYGEGMGDAILAFVSSIPDKKIGDIADAAIAFAKNYGVAMEDTYYFINFLMYTAGGPEDFDIETKINEYYKMTVADVLAEAIGLVGEEAAEYKAALKEQMADVAASLLESTIDEIYAMYFYVGALEEEFSLLESIAAFLDMMGEAVEAEIVVDENGALVGVDCVISADGDEVSFSASKKDGALEIAADIVIGEKDYLDIDAVVDPITGVADIALVVRGDRYVYEEVYDEDWEEYFTERVYKDFGVIFDLAFEVTLGESAEGAFVLCAYDETLGEVMERITASFVREVSEDRVAMGVEINGTGILLYREFAEDGASEAGFDLTVGGETVSGRIGFKDVLEGDEIVSLEITADLTVASEDMLDFYAVKDYLTGETNVAATIRSNTYDAETDSYSVEDVAEIEAEIVETADGQKLTFTLVDCDGAEMVGSCLFTEEYTGEKMLQSVDVEIKVDGETVADGKLSLEMQATETEQIVAVAYDIARLITGYGMEDIVNILKGAGKITLTVEG